ncbi:hypothetical protein C0991_007188 [Blastosporella zonata]|nr:hypothetical protein C0991_007188 [Blastosporella zonata]
MALAGFLLIILLTARLSVDTANVFVAFIKHSDRDSRIAYLGDVTAPLFTTKHSLLVAVLFVGDSFVNWRCWIVWGKKLWIIIVPIILSCVSAASGSYTMWAYAHLPSQQIISELHWLTAFYVLSLVANAMSTSLLAYRIHTVRKQANQIQPSTYTSANGTRTSRPGHRSLKPILHIILESGVMNAAYLFAYTMCLVTKSQGLEVMSEMACPLTGIVFVIVIIRVGLYSSPDAYWPAPRSQLSATNASTQFVAADSHIYFVPNARKGTVGTDVTATFNDGAVHRGDVELNALPGTEDRFYAEKKDVPL